MVPDGAAVAGALVVARVVCLRVVVRVVCVMNGNRTEPDEESEVEELDPDILFPLASHWEPTSLIGAHVFRMAS